MKNSLFLSIILLFVCMSLDAQWTFLQVKGGKKIYCDNGKVWTIGVDDKIYSFDGNGSNFTEYPGDGRAKDIAVYNGVPYLIGMDDAVYEGSNGKFFEKLPGGSKGKKIYCDNKTGKVWVIGLDDKIYSFNGKHFIEYPGDGRAKEIAVYDGVPYLIGMDDAVYEGSNGKFFEKLPGGGKGKKIYCDNKTGKVWIVGLDDKIYSFNGKHFTEYPGDARIQEIAGYGGKPYFIGMKNGVYQGD